MALKFMSAAEAAALVKHGDHVGFSGFTHAGCPKVVPVEIANIARKEHEKGNPFQISVFTGASTGDKIDGELARAKAIKFRTPYQTCKDSRNGINNGEIEYCDLHLSTMSQDIRYGYYGNIDVAIIEACDVTEDGEIVPTVAVGISPTVARLAKIVIVELNRHVPKGLRGMHDLAEPLDPPHRKALDIYNVKDRVGTEYIKVDPAKIIVVETDEIGEGGKFAPVDEITAKIGQNVADFFVNEMKEGRMPKTFLPVQSGVGNIANAVLAAMGDSKDIPDFEVYTEVIQDAVIDLMRSGRVKFASGCSLTVSNECMEEVYKDLDFFKDKVVLRPAEYSNNPEIVRRLGIIAINTAIEADIFGNINSTHISGTKMMNGIGGSGDFTRSAYVSIFVTPSVAKDGKISAIVPMVSHEDHSEHSVKIIISEYGVADLRGKCPKERALEIINKCAHPEYRPILLKYLENAEKNFPGQTPFDMYNAFSFHKALRETGDMRNAKIEEI
ncbi:succinate CoA transferase [Dysgonomonas massiliensis]|uniref:succinate CoA transferase n=1 Tax=Dysgonomonas massiliensis TaxID=2040292 RepID=UPI000C761D3D|nr:succinate CoA transferase [Dysgonomonas massiliensis]